MATCAHAIIMYAAQNHSLFHLFDYYVDVKQGFGFPEMSLFERFYSCETRQFLAGVCAKVKRMQDLDCS